jgi:hypothetical protein
LLLATNSARLAGVRAIATAVFEEVVPLPIELWWRSA